MTKLRIMSDLHLEFGPLDIEPAGEDVLVLGGDIGIYTDGAHWAREYAQQHGIPVVMIAGNHEFYNQRGRPREHTVDSTLAALLRERLPPRYQPDKPVVVVTHHLPSARSIAGRYADSDYNAAYASRLDDLVEASEAALWVHGHTHVSQDYQIGGTRVVCNPRGYDGYELNPSFDPGLIVEIA